MRLLVCTQAVDRSDPVLGFFHGWLEALAKSCQSVQVICLKEGEHRLPSNIFVYSLGKEGGRSLLKYIFRFYYYAWSLRSEYDAVFVHMNQEYVLMGGLLWRLMGKRIILWRNHKKGSWLTRVAGLLAHVVCYTSLEAYVARSRNSVQMPIGIDIRRFQMGGERSRNYILFLGRLDPVKKVDVFAEAIRLLRQKGITEAVDIVGDPTQGNEAFAERIKSLIANLGAFTLRGAVPNDMTPEHYSAHSVYVNLTPSGSFDKTIGEAMASGCIPVVANRAIAGIVPEELLVDPGNSADVARGIEVALKLDEPTRDAIRRKCRDYVEREHSLPLLVERLVGILKT